MSHSVPGSGHVLSELHGPRESSRGHVTLLLGVVDVPQHWLFMQVKPTGQYPLMH